MKTLYKKFWDKKIVSQTPCFSNQSLRTSPKKKLNLFIRYDLDPGNLSQAEFWAIFEILSQCKWDLTHFSPFKVSSCQSWLIICLRLSCWWVIFRLSLRNLQTSEFLSSFTNYTWIITKWWQSKAYIIQSEHIDSVEGE